MSPRRKKVRNATVLAALGAGAVLLMVTAFAGEGSSAPVCAREEMIYALAAEEFDRAGVPGDVVLAERLERAKEEAFALYCSCLQAAAAGAVGDAVLLRTPGRRGTPSFVPPRGTPRLTPPGPPVGRPPVTLPPTPRRGRPVFTPPGPPPHPRPTRTPTP